MRPRSVVLAIAMLSAAAGPTLADAQPAPARKPNVVADRHR